MEASSLRLRPNIVQRWTMADRLRRSAPIWTSMRPLARRRVQLSMQIKCSSTGAAMDEVSGSHSTTEHVDNGKIDHNGPAKQSIPSGSYGKAKLHDFCLGIPFGGSVFSAGVIGFLFSRNLDILSTGVLLGGAIVAFGTCSLKFWRQGKSSLLFVLGQAVMAAILLVKHFRTYSLSHKILPSGVYVAFSAAMLCFYTHVLLSGGNPPPKKSIAASAL